MNRLLFAIIPLLASALCVHAATRPDLTGKILAEDGSPLTNATVFVYTAGPKVGTGSICPSCYPDCRKKARTDSEGRFKIESLDSKLIFRLLVVGPDQKPKFVPKVDPSSGPREIVMDPAALEEGRDQMRGIVINSEGSPVFGAVLNVDGVERGRGTRWGGVERDADPLAVTDENGLFTLSAAKDLSAVHARLEAPGYAKRWVRLVPGKDHFIRVDDGVIVRGRILSNGKPVQNGIVALVTVEREAGKSLHDFEAITNENGEFAILNVTPERDYYLFGKMESLREAGALPVNVVKAGRTGSRVEAGDISLAKSHTISGKVVLLDGAPIPPNTRVFLGRDQAWDHTETILGPDGSFKFSGVPAEAASLSVRIKGYKMSHSNPSLDWLNGGIIGIVDRDLEHFIILLEPGEWRLNREEDFAPPGANRQPRDLPLRSARL
jgi:hypothetical protein